MGGEVRIQRQESRINIQEFRDQRSGTKEEEMRELLLWILDSEFWPLTSVHEEGFEFRVIIERRFKMRCLVFKLLPQGGAVAGGLAHELALHAFFILEDEFGAAGLI